MRRLAVITAALLATNAFSAEDSSRRLRFNQEGTLETGDALNEQGCLEDLITVDLDKGPALFRLHSDSFDSSLKIVGPDGVVYENDDFGSGHDAGLNITVKAIGSYRVFVTSANEGEQGGYRLSVQGMRLVKKDAVESGSSALDRVQLSSGHSLAGHAKFGVVTLATVFGSLQLPTDRLSSMKRDAAGLATVQLSDGSQVQGWIDGEAVELKVAGGSALSLPLREIAAFTPAAAATPQVADTIGRPWVVLGESRLLGSWTATTMQVISGLGNLSLPVERIASIQPPSQDAPLGRVIMIDGGRINACPVSLPVQLSGFSLSPPVGVSIEARASARAAGAFVLTLASGDELVGTIGDITVRSPFGAVALAGKDIANLQADGTDPDVLAVTLTNGERVFGKIEAESVSFAWSWGENVLLPRAMIAMGTNAVKVEGSGK
jgi:hypothetical protein